MKYTSEGHLCDEFAALMAQCGHDVYAEVNGWDLVLVRAAVGAREVATQHR